MVCQSTLAAKTVIGKKYHYATTVIAIAADTPRTVISITGT